MSLIFGAQHVSELQRTLEALSTPTATVRRVTFAGIPDLDPTPIVHGVAQALAKIPGRRVLVQPATHDEGWLAQYQAPRPEMLETLPDSMREGVRMLTERVYAGDADFDPKHCDIACVNAGVVSHPDELAALAARSHVLCLVTGPERATADPVLALANAVDAAPALADAVTCMVATRGTHTSQRGQSATGTRWAKLIAKRAPHRIVYARGNDDSYALHRLAATVLQRSLRSSEPWAREETA